jgi:CRP-like cAMP-binding protein
MDSDEIALLERIGKKQHLPVNTPLIQIGERKRDLIILESGTVSVQVEDTEGMFTEVAQTKAMNLIGEMNFIIPTRRTANVVAVTDVELSVFDYSELCELLKSYPMLSNKLFSALNLQLTHKYLAMMSS